MPKLDAWSMPFPSHIPGIRTYAVASELLGVRAPKKVRMEFWKKLSIGQSLSLIAQILTEIEVQAALSDAPASEVDRRGLLR